MGALGSKSSIKQQRIKMWLNVKRLPGTVWNTINAWTTVLGKTNALNYGVDIEKLILTPVPLRGIYYRGKISSGLSRGITY